MFISVSVQHLNYRWVGESVYGGGPAPPNPIPHFVKAGAVRNDLTFFAVCTGWQVVIPQPASHIHNPAGGRAPAPPDSGGGSLPFFRWWGDVSGLKENPHHPATGGPWAQ